ncbi:MAG: 50S ribosomal protein L7ae [Candidatus Aenigmarchaeota archaeon]|nr:50S ribosomal protein L7ae [Candidatus Aenigmarchaeota archaeon]
MNEKEVLDLIETARETGKIRKGINETTKAVERGQAKFVAVAGDIDPPEIAMHIPALCNEKKIDVYTIPSKLELGRASGIAVGTSAVAVLDLGEGKKKSK